MNPQEHRRAMIAAAVIGDEADKFVKSDLGRTVLGMAKQQEQAALELMADVSPSDAAEIERLQNIVHRARDFQGWLQELITNGENAVEAYRKHESTD